MTETTPEADITFHQDLIASLMEAIKDLRQEIEALKNKAKTGGDLESKAAMAMLGELNKAVLACAMTETKLDEYRNRQAGIGREGDALDMGQMRADIGRKLDKLRGCSAPDSIS